MLVGQRIKVRFLVGTYFCFYHTTQISSGTHPVLYAVDNVGVGGLFLWHVAHCLPTSSADNKRECICTITPAYISMTSLIN